jgi:EPS-associated MarR family transcriptional regulator
MNTREDAQLKVLNLLAAEPDLSQRQLAERLGVSLGKTNFLIKALLEKGHLKANNFRRSDNKLGYLYLLTPEGATAKLKLTRAYLIRKEAEYHDLKHEIDAVRSQLAQEEGRS